jgi:TonB family protein
MRLGTEKYLLATIAIVAVHTVAIWALIGATAIKANSQADSNVLTAWILPLQIRPAGALNSGVLRLPISLRLASPPIAVHVPTALVAPTVNRNANVTSAAPTLDQTNSADLGPYVVKAALGPGQGATVVLRVEVLESGDPGRILVDVSSGNPQVDRAAVDYARAQHWFAGLTQGVISRIWIRLGVRLQA